MSLKSDGFNQSGEIRCLLTTRHATSFTDARPRAVSAITHTRYCLDGRSGPETVELLLYNNLSVVMSLVIIKK